MRVADLDVRSGSLSALDAGGLLVSTSTAATHHWRLGSQVPVGFGQAGSTTFQVAGTYASKGAFGDYLLGLETLSRATGVTTDSQLMVKAAPGTSLAALQARIGALLGPYPGARVRDADGFRRANGATFDAILNLITALLALAVLIALLGIVKLSALAGVLAAIAPARRAARLDVLTAIATE